MNSAEEALAAIEKLQRSTRRSWPMIGIALVFMTAALVLLLMWSNDRAATARRQGQMLEENARAREEVRRYAAEVEVLKARLVASGAPADLVAQLDSQAKGLNAAANEIKGPNGTPSQTDQSIAPIPAAPDTTVRTVTRGVASGWDVDVFWCRGAGEAGNYALARMMATALGRAGATSTVMAPGVRVGQVRIRPVRAQDRGAWLPGAYVTGDSNPGETDAAIAIAKYLTGSVGQSIGTARSVGNPTKWYLSAFACNG